MNTKWKRGFTLIELIVVIAVIGILATITALGFNRYQADSRDARRVSSATTIAEALEKYYDANGEYPSCSTVSGDLATVSSALKGISTSTLVAPQAAAGTTNSISCSTLTLNGTDFFQYVGDGSNACANTGACLEYSIKYKSESSNGGEIKTINSRHSTSVATSGTPTITNIDTSFDSADLTWSEVPGASSYLIQRSAAADTSFNTPTEYTSASPNGSFTATGLSTNTTYNFRVKPLANSSTGNFSASVQATTLNVPTPGNVAATPTSSTAVNVTWNSVATATSYDVRYSLQSNMSSPTTFTGIAVTNRSVTGLTTGTSYYFQVRAINGAFASSWSAAQLAIPIGQATIASTSAGSCGSVTVNWNALAGASTYTIRWSNSSNMSGATTTTGFTGTSGTVSGVTQGATVYVNVSGVTSNNFTGQASTASSQATTICVPPSYTISASFSGSTYTATSNAVCPSGTTANYQWYANGSAWVNGDQYQSVGYGLSYGQGVTLTVNTRCYNASNTGPWAAATNSASYTRPVPAPTLNALSGTSPRVNASWNGICGGLNELLLQQGSYTDTSNNRFALPNNYGTTDTRVWYSTGTVYYRVRTNCNGVWSGWSNQQSRYVTA